MKLITPPKKNTDFLINRKVAGTHDSVFIDCQILCPDKDDVQNVVWNRLKHGLVKDLWLHERVEILDFPEDRIRLYGVKPIHMTRSDIWSGRVFDCKIDYFEEY